MAPTFLILLGAAAVLRADGVPGTCKFSFLPPANFTIKATGLAQVLLRWEPNPDQERRKLQLGYHVRIHAPQADDYETKNTESRRVSVLHQGFSASVRTVPWEGRLRTVPWEGRALPASRWVSAELEAPPGSPGTSAVNLTCTTNTVASNLTESRPYWVSLRCAWHVGKEAPLDTQYFFYYRYGSQTEECREYSQDALKRNVACWFPRTFIQGKGRDSLAVHINGSSRCAAIKPHDQLFALHEIDQVNPPGNVTAEIEGTRLALRWEKPVSAFPAHCFNYEVKMRNTGSGYTQTRESRTNEFNTTVSEVSKYCIAVRAALSSLCREGSWGPWSRPVLVGREGPCARPHEGAERHGSPINLERGVRDGGQPAASTPDGSQFVGVSGDLPSPPDMAQMAEQARRDERTPWMAWCLTLVMVALCVLLAGLVSCSTCHVWTTLFPAVPGPKSDIKDLAVTMNYEKTGSGETESEVISYVEEPGLEVLDDFVF
ncbi:interleukin-5 receptor subunit alpha [Pteronotus mesoamericanus]|uniref:interleukin-5 receptor subunit alpha n=1 Tax=Pteronotus mesoamericanus TaxID=1884717 RepID=UPI0023EE0FB0|nr:interleukin-5 receptor subunit alpha [Pteronotus parnellii mesoamericanus]